MINKKIANDKGSSEEINITPAFDEQIEIVNDANRLMDKIREYINKRYSILSLKETFFALELKINNLPDSRTKNQLKSKFNELEPEVRAARALTSAQLDRLR